MTKKERRDLTKIRTPHTYAIIFVVVIFCWVLTFLIPAGKFSTHEVEYIDSNGDIKTRTVLRADTFRYSYDLNDEFLFVNLPQLAKDVETLNELGVDKEALDEYLLSKEENKDFKQEELDELGLTDDVLYSIYGEDFYDTSKNFIRLLEYGELMILTDLVFELFV